MDEQEGIRELKKVEGNKTPVTAKQHKWGRGYRRKGDRGPAGNKMTSEKVTVKPNAL